MKMTVSCQDLKRNSQGRPERGSPLPLDDIPAERLEDMRDVEYESGFLASLAVIGLLGQGNIFYPVETTSKLS